MTTPTRPPTRVCPRCGTTLAASDWECWMCPLVANPTARPPPDPPPEKGRPWQFSLRTLLVFTTAVAIHCAASVAVPLLWIGLPLLALAVWPVIALRRRTIRDNEWTRCRFGYDSRDWLPVPIAIVLTVPAGCAAFFNACSISHSVQAQFPPVDALGLNVVIGSAVGLAAIVVLTGYLLSALPKDHS